MIFKYFLAFFFLSLSCQAAEVEINGLVLDQTRTAAGRAFHQEFVKRWSEPYGVSNYNITIKELPSARWGGRLQILVNDGVVTQFVLHPRLSVDDQKINQSISAVRQYLLEHKGNGFSNKGTEDLKGNGF